MGRRWQEDCLDESTAGTPGAEITRIHKGRKEENGDVEQSHRTDKEIMPELSTNIALFPPVILDNLSSSSRGKGAKEVCAHYIIIKIISSSVGGCRGIRVSA